MLKEMTQFRYIIETKQGYDIMAILLKEFFDSEDSWPVEKYNAAEKAIEFKEVDATEDEVIEMVETFFRNVDNIDDNRIKDTVKKINFRVEGTTRFEDGQHLDYIIERTGGNNYIRETDSYYFYGSFFFDSYADYCEQLRMINNDPEKAISENEFDSSNEHAVTYTRVYVNETPEYGPLKPLSSYMKNGSIKDIDNNEDIEDVLTLMAGNSEKRTLESGSEQNNREVESEVVSAQELTDYLKHVMELESALYTLKEARKQARNNTKYSKPLRKSFKEPVRKPYSKEPEKPVEPKDWLVWWYILIAIGIVAIICAVSMLGRGFTTTLGIGGSIVFSVIFLAIGIPSLLIGKSGVKTSKITDARYKEELEKYTKSMEEYEQQKKAQDKNFEQSMLIFERKTEEYEAEYKEKCDLTRGNYEAALSLIKEFDRPIDEISSTLAELYDRGYIYPKYRYMVAVCTMYEYFESGRVNTLTGPNGAYNLYEEETRQNIIINSLDKIVDQLEQIKKNQYALYKELNKTNTALFWINKDINSILRSSEKILSDTQAIAQSTHITACCAEAIEKNTEAAAFLTLLKN